MSILQGWVEGLGLRHQGVLLTAIRGCDTAPKNDASKRFVRCYRSVVLKAHCGDAKKAASFIDGVDEGELASRFDEFRRDLDHYPHHYVMHMLHAIEIVGYKHSDKEVAKNWLFMYSILCKGLHVNYETEMQLDSRLNADEASFASMD
jgi:hypothetical protein